MNKKSTTLLIAALLLGLGLGVLLARQTGQAQVAGMPASVHEHAEGDHGEEEHGEGGHVELADDGHEGEAGMIKLSQEQIDLAGIELAAITSRQLQRDLSLPGEIGFDEDRTAHMVPRAAGVVESVAVVLGQQVKEGELLAVIASPQISEQRSELAASQRRLELARNTYQREKELWQEGISAEQDYLQARQALQEAEIAQANARQKSSALSGTNVASGGNRYELRAPFAGQIVEKHLVPGEVVNETTAAFTLSDLSRLWVTFGVAPRDLSKVRAGMAVTIVASELGEQTEGRISHVGSPLGAQTRTASVRITLDNPSGAWRPGLFVAVQVPGERLDAALSVPDQAIQTLENQPTVFVRNGEGFSAQPVELGAKANGYVEIRRGLNAGQQVATAGSFVLKSELGKASAEHAH